MGIRTFALTLLLVFLTAIPRGVLADNRPTPAEVDSVRTYAREFLHKQGADTTGIRLDIRDFKDHVLYLSDRNRRTFLLMVRQPWTNLVTERVVAYSTNSRHGNIRNVGVMNELFNHYDTLVNRMAANGLKELPILVEKVQHIKPLMSQIQWTQWPLYNILEGQEGSVISGCGAVAVAQLMKFHQWPDTVRGNFSYTDRAQREIRMEMDGIRFNWNTIKDAYESGDKDSLTLDTVLRCVSIAIQSHFGRDFTASSPSYLAPALVKQFGYSTAMRMMIRNRISEANMQLIIRQEVQDGRPVILSGGQHIFLCDGVDGDFLHFKMGWAGHYDGWYRIPVTEADINPNAFLVTALVRIMPPSEESLD